MKNLTNIWLMDRFVRLLLAEALFIGAFFWAFWTLQFVGYAFAGILLVTGIVGFCPLYGLFKTRTNNISLGTKPLFIAFMIAILIGAPIAGVYASVFFTKKIFIEDYNMMNQYYKQTLFYSGKEKRDETISNYELLVPSFSQFRQKYLEYRPYVLRDDTKFENDIEKARSIILMLDTAVHNGDLIATHKTLEQVRPIFQDILKRNGFSMLAVALVDFHDSMEKVIDAADKKDSSLLLESYKEADEKLKTVEMEVNDAEIIQIRTNLEKLKSSAESRKNDILSEQAQEMKASFVKVYLKRG